MNIMETRRQLLFAGTGSLLVAGVSQATAPCRRAATPYTATEKANLRTVREFFAAWDHPDLNIDELLARYVAPGAPVRWFEGEPPVFGPQAAAESAKRTAGDQLRVGIEILEMFAHGPLVATSRIDTVRVPGRPNLVVKTAGFHIVRNGRFEEYADFTAS